MTPDSPVNDGESGTEPTPSERQSSTWDLRNAPRNYFALVAFQIGGSLLSFAAILLITKTLGSEGYGGIVAVIAASQIVLSVVNWTAVAVVRFGVDEFIDTEKIARTFWVRLIVLTLNGLILVALAPHWFPLLSDWLRLPDYVYYLVIIHFGISAIWMHVQMSLQGVKLLRHQGFLLLCERFVIFATLAGLYLAGSFTQIAAIACYIAGPALTSLAGVFLVRRYIFSRFRLEASFIKQILWFSAPLLPYYLIGLFATGAVDAIFISKLLSTKDLGFYAVASQTAGIALQLPTLANNLLLPFFVSVFKEGRLGQLNRYFAHSLPLFTLGWGVFATFASFLAFFAVPMVFGEDFRASVGPLWILLANSTFNIPILLGFGSLCNAASLTYIALVGAALSAIVNGTLNALLIPIIGLDGSAWATSMLYLATSVTFAVLLRKNLKTNASWTFMAMVPAFVGSVSMTIGPWPLLSAALCFLLSLFLLVAKRNSLSAAIQQMKTLRTV